MQVSVIIPTYNSAQFLTEAIDSVLAQSFKDFEILVIDDGSTDETKAVMQRYGSPVRYIYQANAGVAVARNRGIEESQGKYVAFLDADDTWFADKLERQIKLLENPDNKASYRVCYSAFAVVDTGLSPLFENRSQRRASALEDLLLRGNIVGSICTVLAERLLFSEAGGFDPNLSQCADWDMWVRLAAHTEFLYIDEPLVTYRHHGAMMSKNAALLESDSVQVLKKGFEMPGIDQSLQARRRQAFARNYMVLAGTYFHASRYLDFLRCAARSLAMDMRQGAYLASFPIRLASRRRGHHSVEGA